MPEFRAYKQERDQSAVHRIWLETGWIDKGEAEAMDLLVASSRAMVAEVNGAAECLVLTVPGTMRYLDQDLPFAGITAVTTSRIARKQGLASRLAALALAADAAEGAFVSGLGMFEQGFYNQLGFGTGSYEHWVAFDPARLRVKVQARIPRRITPDDWQMVHASRLGRMRRHGSCNLHSAEITRAEMQFTKNGFGLGFDDGPDGALTHHIWCRADEVEHGPYGVRWTAFQTWDQFLELMALIHNLGDQVRSVRMIEPPGIQFQDLIEQPFKQRQITTGSRFESGARASAYWQVRMNDVPGCMEQTHLRCGEIRFNLALSDPIERFLDASGPWHGVGGNYVVILGPSSGAELGTNPALPTLTASVGAFTRLWLGVLPATGLAVTDQLSGSRELLAELDDILRLPKPMLDWDL